MAHLSTWIGSNRCLFIFVLVWNVVYIMFCSDDNYGKLNFALEWSGNTSPINSLRLFNHLALNTISLTFSYFYTALHFSSFSFYHFIAVVFVTECFGGWAVDFILDISESLQTIIIVETYLNNNLMVEDIYNYNVR